MYSRRPECRGWCAPRRAAGPRPCGHTGRPRAGESPRSDGQRQNIASMAQPSLKGASSGGFGSFSYPYAAPQLRKWKGKSTDPSVCPLHTSSPIPQRPMCSGPGGRRPPGQRRPRAARRTACGRRRLEGCVPDAFRTGGLPRGRDLGFARAAFIFHKTTATPLYLTPHNSASNAPNGPKGFHPTTKRKVM